MQVNKILSLLTIFISPYCFAEVFQWQDNNGKTHYSDVMPDAGANNLTEIQLKEPVLIEATAFNNNETRIISWEVTNNNKSYIDLAVKYFYDGEYKNNKTWLSAYTMENGTRSMNYSVRPAKIEKGTGIVNIRLGVNTKAPKEHCTNKIGLTMYGKDIPIFHKATIDFNKCWINNYIPPTESSPGKGIQ